MQNEMSPQSHSLTKLYLKLSKNATPCDFQDISMTSFDHKGLTNDTKVIIESE